MADRLVECVPNFSEGRDKRKIDEIVIAARTVPGVVILDVERDPDHNRCVLTFVAPAEAALEAAFRCAKKASELIDMNEHKGEHPRMGATDVIPFIPVSGSTLEECAGLAQRLGRRLGEELLIPVFLYDKAALRPERRDLAAVRKGQFEGLKEAIGRDPERDPDFGPKKMHPTAGATAVGARDQIINFNINLASKDLALAKHLAKDIRASSGGFSFVRAKEIDLKERGMVQVSTVLTNYRETPIAAVFDKVVAAARQKGVEVASTEIVGLVPQAALVGFAGQALKLEKFLPNVQILENQLAGMLGSWELSAGRLADALAAPTPTPGGGSASAAVGALGAALGLMVARVSTHGIEKKREQFPDADRRLSELAAFEAQLQALLDVLKRLVTEDAQAFEAVMEGYRTPKTDPDRAAIIQRGLKNACEVPLSTARAALSVLHRLAELERLALGTVASDLKVGRHLCRAAIYGALENVKINLPAIKDAEYAAATQKAIIETMKAICD